MGAVLCSEMACVWFKFPWICDYLAEDENSLSLKSGLRNVGEWREMRRQLLGNYMTLQAAVPLFSHQTLLNVKYASVWKYDR